MRIVLRTLAVLALTATAVHADPPASKAAATTPVKPPVLRVPGRVHLPFLHLPAARRVTPAAKTAGRTDHARRHGHAAAKRAPAKGAASRLVPCGAKPPPAGAPTFAPGEALHYDLDVLGVRAGTLDLGVEKSGDGLAFTAFAKSNTFFENVRKVRGRATSFARKGSLMPTRYREDATEDGVKKWADVHFEPRHEVDISYAVGSHRRRVRYEVQTGPYDELSLVYYLRTLDLSRGRFICVDVYGNRNVWRVRGKVDGEEWIDTPAGKFKTWRMSGSAQRLDMPSYKKALHVWISEDKARLPVAAVGEIDIGPVRALLSQVGTPKGDGNTPDYSGGRW